MKKRNSRIAELTVGNVYRVIGIEADEFRIMNDIGQPFLYPPKLFDVIDRAAGVDWVFSTGSEGEKYAYPRELSEAGFFEDFFDGRPQAQAALQTYLRKSNRRAVPRRATSKRSRQHVA